MASFIKKIVEYNQQVTGGALGGILLAWEFDPSLFQEVLKASIAEMKKAGIPYDLLQARKPGSPEQMLEQGFNLSSRATGNDWSHISIGFIPKLNSEEVPSIYNTAKSHVPTYKLLKISTLEAPTSGLNYLVIDLDLPSREVQLKKALRSRFDDFVTGEDRGYPERPHVSILGFKKSEDSKVKALIPALNKVIQGKTAKPEALQLHSA